MKFSNAKLPTPSETTDTTGSSIDSSTPPSSQEDSLHKICNKIKKVGDKKYFTAAHATERKYQDTMHELRKCATREYPKVCFTKAGQGFCTYEVCKCYANGMGGFFKGDKCEAV